MEYACGAWDPHYEKDIDTLEKVQNRAARFIKDDYRRRSSVSEMKERIGLPSLRVRREQYRLTIFYAYRKENFVMNNFPYIGPPLRPNLRTSHEDVVTSPFHRPGSNYIRQSFLFRTINTWNELPPETVAASSRACFRGRLVADTP